MMSLTARQLSQSAPRRARLLEICNALPEVVTDEAGKDHISFRIRKRILAYYLFDHHGDGIIALCCKSSLSEQRRLVRDDPETFFAPAYLGARGWVAIRLDLDSVDWDSVTDLARSVSITRTSEARGSGRLNSSPGNGRRGVDLN